MQLIGRLLAFYVISMIFIFGIFATMFNYGFAILFAVGVAALLVVVVDFVIEWLAAAKSITTEKAKNEIIYIKNEYMNWQR